LWGWGVRGVWVDVACVGGGRRGMEQAGSARVLSE
jgi:hypothetical protein